MPTIPIWHVRTIIPTLSATVDPASYGMTFAYLGAGTPLGDWGSLNAALQTFQGVWGVSYGAPSIDTGAGHAMLEAYDVTAHLDGSPAGSPVATQAFTAQTQAVTTALLPEGVACCVSYRANYGTDVEFGTGSRPRARDRNRFYLGPLYGTCLSAEASTHRAQFSSAFITSTLNALNTLALVNVSSVPTWALRTWSRKNASTSVAQTAWIDDRPDYQRRRTDPSVIRTYHALPGD